MTTQFKITRADITADASQNREHEQGCPGDQDYRDCTCGAPAKPAHTPGPYHIIKRDEHHWSIVSDKDSRALLRWKFENSGHSKRVFSGVTIAECAVHYNGSGKEFGPHQLIDASEVEANAKLLVAAHETAAERDRLKEQVSHFENHRDPKECAEIEHERDHAREQVKTLLKACKALVQGIQDHGVKVRVEPDVFDSYLLRAEAAIASIEEKQ